MNRDPLLAFWKIDFHGKSVILTRTEAKLLQCLINHGGEPLKVEELGAETWGSAFVHPSTVRRCINLLRQKLEEDPHKPRLILNSYQFGYYADQELVDHFLG